MKLRKLLNKPPTDYYTRLAQVESGNNPLAQAKTSSAAGLYQFTKGTWEDMTSSLGLDYTLEDRFDPKKSRVVVEEFTKRNENFLKNKLGRKPNDAELYLAHFSGMGGAKKLIEAIEKDPDTLVTDFVSDGALKANKSIFFNKDGTPKKAFEIYNWSAKKFDSPLLDSKKEKVSVTPKYIERNEVVIDNTAVRTPKAPNLATPPINPTYTGLPDDDKKPEAKQVAGMSEEKVRKLFEAERKRNEQMFMNALKKDQQPEEDYSPQYQPEDLSYLYNYINLQD